MLKIRVNLENPKKKTLDLAVTVLKNGGLIICPTDTSYLMGVDATNSKSVNKLFEIKKRDSKKPIHVVVSNLEMASRYVKVTSTAKKLSKAFLPGPLTLVLEKTDGNLAKNLTGPEKTLGVRIPSLKLNRYVAEKLGVPYTATSANKSDAPDLYSVNQLANKFSQDEIRDIDLILDAGDLKKVIPSTVVYCHGKHTRVLRKGPISDNDIRRVLR